MSTEINSFKNNNYEVETTFIPTNRFILFGWDAYDVGGGFGDVLFGFDTLDNFVEQAGTTEYVDRHSFYQVLDIQTRNLYKFESNDSDYEALLKWLDASKVIPE